MYQHRAIIKDSISDCCENEQRLGDRRIGTVTGTELV